MFRAGREGIEPPIRVLETPVIPFNYRPNGLYYIKLQSLLQSPFT